MIELAIFATLLLLSMIFLWEFAFYFVSWNDYDNESKYPILQKIGNWLIKYKVCDILYLFTLIYGNLEVFPTMYEVMQNKVDLAPDKFATIIILIVMTNLFASYIWIFFSFNFRIFNFKFKVPFRKQRIS